MSWKIRGYKPCDILEELRKKGCYDPCEEEFQFWLDYLEEHNKLDCRERLYSLVYVEGANKCEALAYMAGKDCLEIIIEIEEDCYEEFMTQYEYCLWTGDGECAKYYETLLLEEYVDYCDLIEIIREDHFYFPNPVIPKDPPVFPPAEEPEVEPEEPVEEIDPVVPQPPVIHGTPYIEGKIWWYHSDHLGSSSYLTDVNGLPTHYYGYLPFGEIMVEHNNSNYDNVYKFNGKELDESTGYYYYGARYYNPSTSIFLSVDPLAEQFPNYNPYTYTMNNPVNLVDPTGMAPEDLRFRGPGAKKAINTINRGLGGNYASLENGKVNLNITDDQLNSMTSEQKGFYDVVNSAVTHENTTSIGVVESAPGIVAGSLSGGVIDIDDIDNFGSGELMNSTTVLGHEIYEQYQKQALGNTVGSNKEGTGAHDKAVNVESTMNGGWVRGTSTTERREPSEYTQKHQLGGGTIKGKAANYTSTIPFTNSKGEVRNFTYEVKKGNVINKSN